MDEREARRVLRQYLATYRKRSYPELAAEVGKLDIYQADGESGARYQIEIQIFYDDRKGQAIRVAGGIDDGGIRAFVPITDSFIMRPDGTFAGE